MKNKLTTPDPNGLPHAPTRGCPVSAAMFDLLLGAARKGGWPAVFKVFAQGETTTEVKPYGVYERPARRRTLAQFLDKRPDLKQLLDSACQERRDRLLTALENEAEKIALGEGDVTQDFDKSGNVTRKRTDVRNKLRAIETLLKAHDPDTFGDRKRLEVAGQVNHDHRLAPPPNGFVLTPDQIAMLSPHRAGLLIELLDEILMQKDELNAKPENIKLLPATQPATEPSSVEAADEDSPES